MLEISVDFYVSQIVSASCPFMLTIPQQKVKCKHHSYWKAYNNFIVELTLIKSEKFLTNLVSSNRYLASSLSRQMHPLSKKSKSKSQK